MTLLSEQLFDLQSLHIVYTSGEQPLLTFYVTVLPQVVHDV